MKKAILPIVIIVIGVLLAVLIVSTKKEVEKKPVVSSLPVVKVVKASVTSQTIWLDSQGFLSPKRQSKLSAEVAGKVLSLSDTFEVGGRFVDNELLLSLDATDYQLALTQAQAKVAQAQEVLAREQNESKLAKLTWESLNRKGKPSELVLRKPQLAQAQASLAAAIAERDLAKNRLEKTRLRVPFEGVIQEKQVSLGDYLKVGQTVATLIGTDKAIVRLPLNAWQIGLLDWQAILIGAKPRVKLFYKLGNKTMSYEAYVSYTEGSIERETGQFYLVAEVVLPKNQPLLIGQFVEAKIEGPRHEQVFVLPDSALRAESSTGASNTVWIVDAHTHVLQSRTIELAYQDAEQVWVSEGLRVGDWVCLSKNPVLRPGIEVALFDEKNGPIQSKMSKVLEALSDKQQVSSSARSELPAKREMP